jgi:hypothetical protein
MVIPQGVKISKDPPTKAVVFDKTAFAKKSNTGTKIFIGAVILVAVIIIGLIVVLVMRSRNL